MILNLPTVDHDVVQKIKSKHGFGYALKESVRVTSALIARESTVRYGSSRLGYLWAFIEPSLYFLLFLSIRTFINNRVPFGESAILFLLSGILTLRAFLAVSRRMMGSINTNTNLLTFPIVVPFDLIIARAVIEVLTMSTVLILFYFFIVLGSNSILTPDLIEFTAALASLFCLATGVGCFSAVMVILVPTYRVVFGLIGLPLLFASAIFYVPAVLPPEVLGILVWNPVLHCVEWFRDAMYLDYVATLDRWYPVKFGLIAGGLGILMTRLFRVRMMD